MNAPTGIDISPNESGPPGISQLRDIVGAVITVGLILAVLAVIISAIVWAFGSQTSNPHMAGRGKHGVLIGVGAAAVCGAAVTLVNFFWTVGQQVLPVNICDAPIVSSVCGMVGDAVTSGPLASLGDFVSKGAANLFGGMSSLMSTCRASGFVAGPVACGPDL